MLRERQYSVKESTMKTKIEQEDLKKCEKTKNKLEIVFKKDKNLMNKITK